MDILKDLLKEKETIRKEYISYKEAAKKLGKNLKSIQYLACKGCFGDIKKFKTESYIKKVRLEQYIIHNNNNYLSISKAVTKSGLSKYVINNLIKNDIIKAKKINEFLYNIDVQSFDTFLVELKGGYLKEEVCNLLSMKDSEFVRYAELKLIEVYETQVFGTRVIKSDFDKFVNIKNTYYTVQDICHEYGVNIGSVLRRLKEGVIKADAISKHFYLIKKEDFKKFIKSREGIKLCYYGTEKYNEYLNKFIELIMQQTDYKETVNLYWIWAKEKIKKSKSSNKGRLVNYILLTLERMIFLLKDEMCNYTDKDISNLVKNKIFTNIDIEYLTGFINSCKDKRDCKYQNNYNFHFIKSKKLENVIYTKKEWLEYCKYLINMDEHKDKAIKKRRYAETWLFMILHLSLSWRSYDIKKMPNVPIEIIEIDNFAWFEKNDFTLEMAQKIINEMRRRCQGITTSKTRENTHFVIGLIATVPTALAFVICELHRRNSKVRTNSILSLVKYRTNDYELVLGEKMPAFSSLKCNRSLMTYQFETAVNTGGRAYLAYQLCSYARSHKNNLDKHSETTKVYLHTTNTDASAENISYHLFERGFFGWQINVIVDLITNTSKWSLLEKTSAIKLIGHEYSPMAVESISEYVNTRLPLFELFDFFIFSLAHIQYRFTVSL